MKEKLKNELASFQNIWVDGYFEGNPMNPMALSSYQKLGFISTLYATYLRCIKPYVNKHTVSLEIGHGRGTWTKALLPSKEIFAIDALPEDHNKFFEYLGYPKNVTYIQVKDFECEMLPDNHFDYMFSYGCLCHVSFEGIREYARNLYPKLKEGSNCFWMIADYDKYNRAILNQNDLSVWSAFIPKSRRYLPLKWLLAYLSGWGNLSIMPTDEDDEPKPGRWYHAGIERTCSMLEKSGFQIVDPNVGTCLRDPIIHFIKA